MVKIGFICEGESEKIIVESNAFKLMLQSHEIECVDPIIDAGGNGNLLPKHIEVFINRLQEVGAEMIFILTDLDDDKCISLTKERIAAPKYIKVIVVVKQLEAWFLADSNSLSSLFKSKFFLEFPELEANPLEKINNLSMTYLQRGLGNVKPKIARKMLNLGFTIEKAAQHPNCSSAKYFIDKLKEVSLK